MEAELRALRDELSNRSNLAASNQSGNGKDNELNIIEENQNDKKIREIEDQTIISTDHHGSGSDRIGLDHRTGLDRTGLDRTGLDQRSGSDLKIKKLASEKIIENNDNIINLNQSNIKDSQDEFKSNT